MAGFGSKMLFRKLSDPALNIYPTELQIAFGTYSINFNIEIWKQGSTKTKKLHQVEEDTGSA